MSVLVFAAAALAPAAPAFAASAVYDQFHAICLATGAQGAAAGPAAKTAGFSPAAGDAFAGLKQGLQDVTVMTLAAPNGQPRVAFWGRRQATMGGKPYPMRVCAVLDPGADAEAASLAGAWAGVDPAPSPDAKGPAYRVFAGAAGHHKTLANLPQDQAEAALQKGDAQVMTAGVTQEGHTILVYGVIEPSR